ncbi:hypothetical protein N7468_002044 [Penicillium chermesinum]|uniref:Cytochrome oxidase c assembly-domain-containing protein n=1 Tax=Penicillium chermesinum TaxID=63820 RepID=A0A9W9PJF6_9EURO|nr:uncharacterized protein N7468_002044 [Penicillium chermesinum]KAJ5247061.1 hypothetical protein N7468_002044 [Penicillium chermesinum]KAJ6145309.1 hypothetical protein N7470_009204 [Penicillium chermesinum]
MSRSAADATRFTATGPYASSKPYDLSNSAQPKNPLSKARVQMGPDGKPETPKQKVERLRAQARAARAAQASSGADRWIETGRRFANKAHKGVVYSLIAASGVCGILTVYSLVSLTLYNRRQRAVFIEREKDMLNQARIAQANGSATEEQLELVKQVEIAEIMKRKREEEKANRPWAKAKRFLFERANAEDTAAAATATAASSEVADGSESVSVTDAVNAKKAFDVASAKTGAPVPGQLDVMGENAERAAKEATRSWMSWLTGR